MIKVHVPELKPEDVEKVRVAMESFAASLRAMMPIAATLLVQFAQQAAILQRTFRESLEREIREREGVSRAGK